MLMGTGMELEPLIGVGEAGQWVTGERRWNVDDGSCGGSV